MATHSRILVWRTPWTEEPGGLQSMGSQRVGHDWVTEYPWHKLWKKIKSYGPRAWKISNTLLSRYAFWLIHSFQQLSEFGTIIILIYFTDKETEDQPTYKKKSGPRSKGGKAEDLGFDSGLAASCIRTHNYYSTILHPLVVKNPATDAGDVTDMALIPGSGRCPGGGHGNPHHYACLGNPRDREAQWATLYRVAKSLTGLSTHILHPKLNAGAMQSYHPTWVGGVVPFLGWIYFQWNSPWTQGNGEKRLLRVSTFIKGNSPPERTCRDVRICGHMDIGFCNFNKTEPGPHAMW